jgi:hypothetical protein
MNERITLSARILGEVALPGFCPRRFWIKLPDMMCDAILAQSRLSPQLAEKLTTYKKWSMKGIAEVISKQKGLRLGARKV